MKIGWGSDMARNMKVEDYNPQWESLFKAEAKKIKAVLGKNCVTVHHIGSTAVKGLKAKPVIDIMPVVKDISLVDAHNSEMEALGYECMGEYGIPGRRFFIKGGDNRTHHVHIFEESNQADISRHLAVREYLRSHPEAVKEYGALKSALAEQFSYDNDGYCSGKDDFMKDLEQKALAWSKQENQLGVSMSIGMCLGAGIGCALGAAFSNIGMGMCFGVGIGTCFGLIYGSMKNTK